MNQSRRGIKLSPAQIKRLLIILALVAVVLTALVLMLRNRVKQQFGGEEQQVLSASVTTGSISSSVYGSGLLADEDVEQLEIPSGVDVETLYVSRGEKVEEGQLLASAEQNSVVTAMAAVTAEIDALDESIASAMAQTADTLISSAVSGRVKKIYAQYGDSVADIMLEQGALMLLSLDGYMAVDVETDRLSPGDSLTVTDSSGRSYTALITVDKQSSMLSGMSASAVISIDSVENALLIPIDALQKTASTYYVYTTYDEASQTLGGMVEVTVGVTNSQYAEISAGLSEGDTVYYMESSQDSGGFMPGGDFGGGFMPVGGDFGGGMPGGGMPGERR